MTLGSPVVCCVCNAAAVAAEVVVTAAAFAAAAAAAAGSLAAMRPVAKELARMCSLGTCANALQVASSGAAEIVKHRVARVGFCLCMRDQSPLQCCSSMLGNTMPKLACSNL